MEAEILVKSCSELGAVLTPDGLQLRVRGWTRLPVELQRDLEERKTEIVALLKERGFEPLVLRMWRREMIPEWRKRLRESIAEGYDDCEEYARWMLRDILLDADYEEQAGE